MTPEQIQVAALQGVLRFDGIFRGTIDGVLGPVTKKACVARPDLSKQIIESLGGNYTSMMSSLTPAQRASCFAIAEACRLTDQDPIEMIAVSLIESSLVATARNGSFRGLFQLNHDSWNEGRAAAPEVPIGTFEAGWSDPFQNSGAAIGYRRLVSARLIKAGVDSPDVVDLYMGHQQGAAGYSRLKRFVSFESRLTSNIKLDASAFNAMKANPPPDGAGVTLSPEQFLSRWRKCIVASTQKATTHASLLGISDETIA